MPINPTKVKVGVNYAWKNYAWDFGLPPQKDSGDNWGRRAAWKETIAQELAEFAEIGFFCVRWFLLGDGTTYGIGPLRPHETGGIKTQWRFDDPPPLSEEFLEDFRYLLAACEQAGILLLPSLIDFQFCFPGIPVLGSKGIVKCGRSDVLIDPRKRTRFYEWVLRPLLAAAMEKPDSIYAFELMNEPEWCTERPNSPADLINPQKTVPLAAMRDFLREGAEHINDAGFKSTVGFAMHSTLQEWNCSELCLLLHQFHYYAEPPSMPTHTFDPRWPLIVGEFATAPHRPWHELGPAQDVLSRLRHIESKGYPAAFLWSANREEEHAADPPAVDFSETTRALVRRYVHGE